MSFEATLTTLRVFTAFIRKPQASPTTLRQSWSPSSRPLNSQWRVRTSIPDDHGLKIHTQTQRQHGSAGLRHAATHWPGPSSATHGAGAMVPDGPRRRHPTGHGEPANWHRLRQRIRDNGRPGQQQGAGTSSRSGGDHPGEEDNEVAAGCRPANSRPPPVSAGHRHEAKRMPGTVLVRTGGYAS